MRIRDKTKRKNVSTFKKGSTAYRLEPKHTKEICRQWYNQGNQAKRKDKIV